MLTARQREDPSGSNLMGGRFVGSDWASTHNRASRNGDRGVLVGSLVRDESAQGSSDPEVPLPGGASLLLRRERPVR